MLQTYYKNYNQFLPFGLILIFERQGSFNDMVLEAAKRYPQLAALKCDTVRPNVMSFVYSPLDTNAIYLFATDELRLDVLVHECFHITMRIFDAIGSEVNEHTEENFAYLNEMIFRDVYNALEKKFKFTPSMSAKRPFAE
ncbi:MAG: hypothetical protein E6R03_17695 [Hyphomicrobiaceae bacterium]|nr:MAG: hypothetical protein E6R03_17695 [Hyphomicrobiaceae bacterium]